MWQVLKFVCDQHHRPLLLSQELEDAVLHQMVTQVDVQGGERVVL